MTEYFELELDKGDLFKGELDTTSSEFKGLAFFLKRGKFLMVGVIGSGALFSGYGVYLDLSENALYFGSFLNNLKHGYGQLTKFKSSQNP